MPKIVDPQQRRDEIAAVTLAVISKVGLENTTIRMISREGGFSSGVISHYFRDKNELTNFAFELVINRAFAEIEHRASKRKPGLARLRESMAVMLPRKGDPLIAVSMGFWGRAVDNPSLSIIFSKNYTRWRDLVQEFLKEAIDEGEISNRDLTIETDFIISFIDGLSIAMQLEPKRFPAARREALLDLAIFRIAQMPADGSPSIAEPAPWSAEIKRGRIGAP
jgi:AcrR family transcriptional regulator